MIRSTPSRILIIIIVLLFTMIGPASAVTAVWTGATSTAWGTTTNWNPAGSVSGDNVILTGAGTYLPTSSGTLTISCLTFDSTTTTPFTVSGGTLTINGATAPQLFVDPSAAGHTISSAITLGRTNQQWNQNSPDDFTISGVISDGTSTFNLIKTGPGTLIFSGTNLYNGATTISDGTLSLGDGVKTGNIIPAANSITNNAALIYNTPSSITHTGVISGSGIFTKSGTGTLILSGTNTYTGITTVSDGTLQIGTGGTGTKIPVTNLITNDAALIYSTSSTITHSGVISGAGSFTKSGTGTLTLSGTNTYTGLTTVSAGTLILGTGSGATKNIIPASNAIHNDAALRYSTASPITHSGNIDGSGTFTKLGSSTLILSGSNSYSGTTTLSAGVLQLGDGVATGNIIPAGNSVVTSSGTSLIYNTPSTVTHSGVISGAGTFTKDGPGILILSGINSYTGATTVSEGELQFNGANTGTSVKTVSGGTLSGTGTIPGAVTVANVGSSTIRGGTGSGSTGTLNVGGTLTFSGTSGSLDVTSDGTTGVSKISVGTNTISVTGMTVNLLDPTPHGNYTIISKTSGTMPTTKPVIGENNSGQIAYFDWIANTGLRVALFPVPVVSGITPNYGNSVGGTSVVITGSGFYGAGSASAVSAVKFGNAAATSFTVNSDTQITATAPAGSYGTTVDITVTTPGGTSETSSSDTFAYVGIPTFTGITPGTGPIVGGTNVNITGTNFTPFGMTTITFSSYSATNVAFVSATEISGTFPSHPLGSVSVTVTTPGGSVTQSGAYTYVSVPTFTSIAPSTGATTGGVMVNITGTNFVGATSVNFGGTTATGVNRISGIEVSATAPAHAAGYVNVDVITPNGTATGGSAFRYITPSVAISLNQSSMYLPMTAGSTVTNSSLGITVTANAPFTVTVKDNTVSLGRTSGYGYMGKFTGIGYDIPALKLSSPLQLAGTTNGTTTAQMITPPILTAGQTLYMSSTSATSQVLAPNIFSQPVAASDPHLTGSSVYRIDLVFTIQAV